MGISKSMLEIRVSKFVGHYGAEQLIEWLDEFDFLGGPIRYRQFKRVEKYSCEAFGISIADMHGISNTETTNAKRIISFISSNWINLKPPVIAKLLGNISQRSVAYYIKDVEDWITNPNANKRFYEAYLSVFDKFNIDL